MEHSPNSSDLQIAQDEAFSKNITVKPDQSPGLNFGQETPEGLRAESGEQSPTPENRKDISPEKQTTKIEGNEVVVRVPVNRARSPLESIKATGRRGQSLLVNTAVAEAMPRGEGNEVEVVFFQAGHLIDSAAVDEAYAARNLIPADPYSLAAVNEADPAFADKHPNSTHWKGKNGTHDFMLFDKTLGVRTVCVDSDNGNFSQHKGWWLAGLRKST